jgi:hypothetical protein
LALAGEDYNGGKTKKQVVPTVLALEDLFVPFRLFVPFVVQICFIFHLRPILFS